MCRMAASVRYRVEQFLRALAAPRTISEGRAKEVVGILCPSARALFARQTPQDQRHALAVYDTLRQEGHTREELLTAALLHDVGKVVAQLRPWERGALVLTERLAPRVLDRITRDPPEDWRRPVARYARHAEIGAHLAEGVGCSPLTVELIRRHEEHLVGCQTEVDRLLTALQAADGIN